MELYANDTQTVQPNESVMFQTALSAGSSSILWRAGSGVVTLRGLGPQLRSRFRVSYHLNVALSTGADVAPIEMAVRISGETLASSRTVSTPGAVEEFNSVGATTLVDVPAGCCVQISLTNIGTSAIDTENVDMIVERVA
jgi:hypothetical protein